MASRFGGGHHGHNRILSTASRGISSISTNRISPSRLPTNRRLSRSMRTCSISHRFQGVMPNQMFQGFFFLLKNMDVAASSVPNVLFMRLRELLSALEIEYTLTHVLLWKARWSSMVVFECINLFRIFRTGKASNQVGDCRNRLIYLQII